MSAPPPRRFAGTSPAIVALAALASLGAGANAEIGSHPLSDEEPPRYWPRGWGYPPIETPPRPLPEKDRERLEAAEAKRARKNAKRIARGRP